MKTLALIIYIAYRLVKRVKQISHEKLPCLLIGMILSIMIPALLYSVLNMIGINACIVSIVGIFVVIIYIKIKN